MSDNTPEADAELAAVQALIAEMPPDSQRRIAVIAGILRDLLAADPSGESMLAFTLVLAEVSK